MDGDGWVQISRVGGHIIVDGRTTKELTIDGITYELMVDKRHFCWSIRRKKVTREKRAWED